MCYTKGPIFLKDRLIENKGLLKLKYIWFNKKSDIKSDCFISVSLHASQMTTYVSFMTIDVSFNRHATHKLTLVPFIKQRIRQLSDNQFHENTTDKLIFC